MKRLVICSAFGLISAVALLGLQTSPNPNGDSGQTRGLKCPGILYLQVANEIGNPLVWVLNGLGNLWARAFGGELDRWAPMAQKEKEFEAEMALADSLFHQKRFAESRALMDAQNANCEFQACAWGAENYFLIKVPPLFLLSGLAMLAFFKFLGRYRYIEKLYLRKKPEGPGE